MTHPSKNISWKSGRWFLCTWNSQNKSIKFLQVIKLSLNIVIGNQVTFHKTSLFLKLRKHLCCVQVYEKSSLLSSALKQTQISFIFSSLARYQINFFFIRHWMFWHLSYWAACADKEKTLLLWQSRKNLTRFKQRAPFLVQWPEISTRPKVKSSRV